MNKLNEKLMDAVQNNSPDDIINYINAGADVNYNSRGFGPLYQAAEHEDPTPTQMLLANGANVNQRCFEGSTALMNAASQCSPKVAAVLLAAGADRAMRNNNGDTAMTLAVASDCQAIIDMLKE